MFFYSALIFLFLMECSPASRRVGAHYDQTPPPPPPPRSNEGRSTHISEFTDPATGLNPFLDLEEGRTGEMGRNIVEDDDLSPPLSDSDLQLVEGGPDDRRSSSRWNGNFGRKWENTNNKPQHVIPMSPTSDITSMGRHTGNRMMVFKSPPGVAETNIKESPEDAFVSSTKISDSEYDYFSRTPTEDHSLSVDYSNEYHEVQVETSAVQEDSAHLKKEPISKNVILSVAITGASVAVIALLFVVCWWKQKTKRESSVRGNVSVTDKNMESGIIVDKNNATNNDIKKKSISA